MKKKYFLKFILISVILIIVGCKKSTIGTIGTDEDETNLNLTEAKNEVIAAGENFVIAISNGDSIGAANCYTRDAKIMRPNSKPIIGRANIQKAFTKRLQHGKLRFSMKTVAVYGGGNELTAEEEWMLSDKDGKIIDEGKSLEVYKKEDGKWKMFRDCFNSNFPCLAE